MFNGQRCKRVTMAPSGLSASPRMGSCMAQEARTAQSNFGKHAESHMVCGGENFSGIAIMYSKNKIHFCLVCHFHHSRWFLCCFQKPNGL